jgi:hypothetical protein
MHDRFSGCDLVSHSIFYSECPKVGNVFARGNRRMRFLHRLQRRRLKAGPAGVPARTVGRHARRPAGAGCRSLGSASPIGSRSGRRLANAVRSRVGTRGTPGGTGETPHAASGVRTPPGSARTVAVVSRHPLPASRLALTPSRDQRPGRSTHTREKTSLWRVCPRAQRRLKRSHSPIFYNRTTAAITAMMMIIPATISQVRLFFLRLACCPTWNSLSRAARCASHRASCSCRVS